MGKYGFWTAEGKIMIKEHEGSNQELKKKKRAILSALQAGPEKMNIVTDSQYVCGLIEAGPRPEDIEEPLLKTILGSIENKEELYIQWYQGTKVYQGMKTLTS